MTSPSAGSLPPIMALPPGDVRKSIPSKEWQSCIESWLVLSHAYLSLPLDKFEIALSQTQGNTLLRFITSYMNCMGKSETDDNYLRILASTDLHRAVFLMVHRSVFEADRLPAALTDWRFLGDFGRVYKRNSNLMLLVEKIWSDHELSITKSMSSGYRHEIVSKLESGETSSFTEDESLALCFLPLLRACPSAGTYFLTGSDFSDAIISAYPAAPPKSQSMLLLLVYLCFLAPLRTERVNQSLLFDHLYSLESIAQSGQNPLLPDLVSNTPFVSKFRRLLHSGNDQRANSLIRSLDDFRRPRNEQLKKPPRRRIDKGKARGDNSGAQSTENGIRVHRISLVTQIQDLFPNLGSGFIVKLLDEYGDDVETATAHLLEDDLPPHLRSLDRSEDIPVHQTIDTPDAPLHLTPRATPSPPPARDGSKHPSAITLPIRRNIHDNDDFDNLRIKPTQLLVGHRRDADTTDGAAESLPATSRAASKAAILSALAAFDADDDERDDTYDLADVGGTVDTATGEEDRDAGTAADGTTAGDAALFAAYKADAGAFARDAATRRGAARRALKEETGMTDEAIEGWGVMVAREPRRLRRLEERFALGGAGQRRQRELGKTAWRGAGGGSGAATTDEEGDGTSSGGEMLARGAARGGRGRGRGGGGRGRGGGADVAGPSGEAATQRSRQRKEASKGSRANHNRRDQRARKMGRGGMPG